MLDTIGRPGRFSERTRISSAAVIGCEPLLQAATTESAGEFSSVRPATRMPFEFTFDTPGIATKVWLDSLEITMLERVVTLPTVKTRA